MGSLDPTRFTENNNVHVLEYFPGHFGDYISNIISHSVHLFYYEGETENTGLWKPVEHEKAIYRKKFPRTLRGNGWEFIEKYKDFHIDRYVHMTFRYLYENEPMRYMFNLHPLLTEKDVENNDDFIKKLRTLTNGFINVQVRYLHIENIWDTVVNEYYTGPGSYWDANNGNIDNLKLILKNHKKIKYYTSNIKNEMGDKIISVPTIFSLTPEHIMCYGRVDVNKFNKFSDDFKHVKLNELSKRKDELAEYLKQNNHTDILDELNET